MKDKLKGSKKNCFIRYVICRKVNKQDIEQKLFPKYMRGVIVYPFEEKNGDCLTYSRKIYDTPLYVSKQDALDDITEEGEYVKQIWLGKAKF